jgi:hypothetical protein
MFECASVTCEIILLFYYVWGSTNRTVGTVGTHRPPWVSILELQKKM